MKIIITREKSIKNEEFDAKIDFLCCKIGKLSSYDELTFYNFSPLFSFTLEKNEQIILTVIILELQVVFRLA